MEPSTPTSRRNRLITIAGVLLALLLLIALFSCDSADSPPVNEAQTVFVNPE